MAASKAARGRRRLVSSQSRPALKLQAPATGLVRVHRWRNSEARGRQAQGCMLPQVPTLGAGQASGRQWALADPMGTRTEAGCASSRRTTSSRTSLSRVSRGAAARGGSADVCTDWGEEETQTHGDKTHLWEESWDDDDTTEDFANQLRDELKKLGK
ncbi:hypothetical protein OPT61_g434 [Boeremia exigua]|uniref:Uncharacterized protein n=1 Tax=Boeremia exigua TaxID=749465 RepID=A0ACC2ITV4_9PLEO|nr:hypothetical protein OPT61_g434 [Boeremia exigua]